MRKYLVRYFWPSSLWKFLQQNFHIFRRKKPLPLWHYPIRNWPTSAAPSPGPNWKVWLPISNLKSLRGTFVSSVQKPNSPYFSLGVIIVNFANKMCALNAFQRWDLQIVFHKFVEFHEVNNTIHSESPLSNLPWYVCSKCISKVRWVRLYQIASNLVKKDCVVQFTSWSLTKWRNNGNWHFLVNFMQRPEGDSYSKIRV